MKFEISPKKFVCNSLVALSLLFNQNPAISSNKPQTEEILKKNTQEQVINKPEASSKKFLTDCKNYEERTALIDIDNQTLKICEGRERILKTLVRTGARKTPTPKGVFNIDSARRNTTLRGPGYSRYVKYFNTIGGEDINGREASGREIGFHDAPWVKNFGVQGSKGCINLKPSEAKRIIQNLRVGTRVAIFDRQTKKRILLSIIDN
jgi:lipoprotein-anchoring transpeptidase ErfK/SrfK